MPGMVSDAYDTGSVHLLLETMETCHAAALARGQQNGHDFGTDFSPLEAASICLARDEETV